MNREDILFFCTSIFFCISFGPLDGLAIGPLGDRRPAARASPPLVIRLSTQNNTVWKMAKDLKSMIGPLQGPTSLVYTEKDMAVVLGDSLHNQFSPNATTINLELVDRVDSEVDNYLAIEP